MSLIVGTVLPSGCDSTLLDPKGQIGLEQRSLILAAFDLMMIVVIPAVLIAVGFAWKYRVSSRDARYSLNRSHSNKAEAVIQTASIPVVLFPVVLTWKITHALEPSKPLAHDKKPITTEAVSMDWEQFFIHPEQDIATVSEIAFPADVSAHFKVTFSSVMDSLFIPCLGDRIYAMTGTQTQLHLTADETDTYGGISASYNGPGFSGMKFKAIATSDRTTFDQRVERAKQSPNSMGSMTAFNKVAVPSECNKVEHSSNVKSDLFKDVVSKLAPHESMNISEPEGEYVAHDGMEGMDTSHAEAVHQGAEGENDVRKTYTGRSALP